MIAYLRGKVAELRPTEVVIECHGVGYSVNISLYTHALLEGKQEMLLYVEPIYREDAQLLYGFAQEEERSLFRLLISVNGVGPNTARVILSSYSPEELSSIIALGEVAKLKAVKGIGAKTAERILIDLRDKVSSVGLMVGTARVVEPRRKEVESEAYQEAEAALKMLGYKEDQIRKALKKLAQEQPDLSSSEIIRLSLRLL